MNEQSMKTQIEAYKAQLLQMAARSGNSVQEPEVTAAAAQPAPEPEVPVAVQPISEPDVPVNAQPLPEAEIAESMLQVIECLEEDKEPVMPEPDVMLIENTVQPEQEGLPQVELLAEPQEEESVDVEVEVEVNPPEAGEGQEELQSIEEEPLTYEQFLKKNPEKSYLKIQAFSSFQAYPISGAKIIVRRWFADGLKIFYNLETDENGIVDNIMLPAPARNLSQTPDNQEPPYALYDIQVMRPGYITKEYVNVPVFSGVKSIQQVEMRPEVTERG